MMASSAAGGPDTSVVDVCKGKIEAALNAEDVKVTGESVVSEFKLLGWCCPPNMVW